MIRPLFVITEAFMRIQSTLTEHFFEDGTKTHTTTKRHHKQKHIQFSTFIAVLISVVQQKCTEIFDAAVWNQRNENYGKFIAGTGFDGKSIMKSGDYLVRNEELHTKSFLKRKTQTNISALFDVLKPNEWRTGNTQLAIACFKCVSVNFVVEYREGQSHIQCYLKHRSRVVDVNGSTFMEMNIHIRPNLLIPFFD